MCIRDRFKPFVMKELVANGTAHNIKNAKKMVEKLEPCLLYTSCLTELL